MEGKTVGLLVKQEPVGNREGVLLLKLVPGSGIPFL